MLWTTARGLVQAGEEGACAMQYDTTPIIKRTLPTPLGTIFFSFFNSTSSLWNSCRLLLLVPSFFLPAFLLPHQTLQSLKWLQAAIHAMLPITTEDSELAKNYVTKKDSSQCVLMELATAPTWATAIVNQTTAKDVKLFARSSTEQCLPAKRTNVAVKSNR